ncbi:MAG: hypothetical protein FJZ59_00320 [Chlamydiae bacterium]|nr:hypothetical protein [Chlamydiota bacterium]
MLPLKRSEEVVTAGGMEWRSSSASPTQRWDAFKKRTDRVEEFARDGKYISLASTRRVFSGRRAEVLRSEESLEKASLEIERLKHALYEVTFKLSRSELSNDVLREEVGALKAEVARLSK